MSNIIRKSRVTPQGVATCSQRGSAAVHGLPRNIGGPVTTSSATRRWQVHIPAAGELWEWVDVTRDEAQALIDLGDEVRLIEPDGRLVATWNAPKRKAIA